MSISKRLRFQVLMRDNFRCRYCGTRDAVLEVDHVEPRARGGQDVSHNLVAACYACNRGKRDRILTRAALDALDNVPGEELLDREARIYMLERYYTEALQEAYQSGYEVGYHRAESEDAPASHPTSIGDILASLVKVVD